MRLSVHHKDDTRLPLEIQKIRHDSVARPRISGINSSLKRREAGSLFTQRKFKKFFYTLKVKLKTENTDAMYIYKLFIECNPNF